MPSKSPFAFRVRDVILDSLVLTRKNLRAFGPFVAITAVLSGSVVAQLRWLPPLLAKYIPILDADDDVYYILLIVELFIDIAVLKAALSHGVFRSLCGSQITFRELLAFRKMGSLSRTMKIIFVSFGCTAIPLIFLVLGIILTIIVGLTLENKAFAFIMLFAFGVCLPIIAIVNTYIITPIFTIESRDLKSSFLRARELVSGHQWTVLGLVIVLLIFAVCLLLLNHGLYSWLSGQQMEARHILAAQTLVSVVLAGIFSAVDATVSTVCYHRLMSLKGSRNLRE